MAVVITGLPEDQPRKITQADLVATMKANPKSTRLLFRALFGDRYKPRV